MKNFVGDPGKIAALFVYHHYIHMVGWGGGVRGEKNHWEASSTAHTFNLH